MRNRTRRLPPLDLIRGFEAAARHLSFTKAAQELFLTQSAVSRQIQALEEHVGVALFQRRHRALLLTDEGQMLFQTARGMLRELRQTLDHLAGLRSAQMVTVTTMVTFASLWLVPRLPAFRKEHPEIDVRISADNEVVDLDRQRIDVAVRYTDANNAPDRAQLMFGEEVLPMCSPALLGDKDRPLAKPEDLRHHVLLNMDDAAIMQPYLDWGIWLQSMGLENLEPAGELHFSHYDQMIQAAIDGQGIVLGRLPLLRGQVRAKRLVTPLAGRNKSSARAYFVVLANRAGERPEVRAFADWLLREAAGG